MNGRSITFERFGKRLNCYSCKAELELLDYCNDKNYRLFHFLLIICTPILAHFGLYIAGVSNLKNITRWLVWMKEKQYHTILGIENLTESVLANIGKHNFKKNNQMDSGMQVPSVLELIRLSSSPIIEPMLNFIKINIIGGRLWYGIMTGGTAAGAATNTVMTGSTLVGVYHRNMLMKYLYLNIVYLYKYCLEKINLCDKYWCAKKVCGTENENQIEIYNDLFTKHEGDEEPDQYFTYTILNRENAEENSKPRKGEKITLDILVNNAGIAGGSLIEMTSMKDLKKKLPKYFSSLPIKKEEIIKAIIDSEKNIKKITKTVHPEIRKKLNIFLKNNKKEEAVILDIPLLLENKLNQKGDIIIFIQSKKTEVTKRLKKRNNFNLNLLNKFKKIQLSLSYKKKKSHFIIKNNFNNKSAKIRVKKIIKEIL